MITHIINRAQKQKGLATVELALITPFLLIIMLVAAEFSRVFYEYNTLTKGVRDAARFAANGAYNGAKEFQLVSGTDLTMAKNIVVYGSINGTGTPVLQNLTPGNITVTQVNTGAAPLIREHVRVSAVYEFVPFAPVLSGMGFLPQDVNLNFTLTASSTMRGL